MRTVHCAEALAWLKGQGTLDGCSVVTSLPDNSELPDLSFDQWQVWFTEAARLTMAKTPDHGVTVFYQTDVKREGRWVDKGFLCLKAAEASGTALLWHKIVCRYPSGTVTFGRAAYAHLLCFSRGQKLDLSKASADVLPSDGDALWTRGMPIDTCLWACRYVLEQTPTRTVVDPFCGRGTVLAAANTIGLDAVGVELSNRRARQARTLTLEGRG